MGTDGGKRLGKTERRPEEGKKKRVEKAEEKKERTPVTAAIFKIHIDPTVLKPKKKVLKPNKAPVEPTRKSNRLLELEK